MDVHPQAMLPGKIRHPLPSGGTGGILGMDGGVHQNLPVPGVVPVFIEADVVGAVIALFRGKIRRVAEIHRPAGQIGGNGLMMLTSVS